MPIALLDRPDLVELLDAAHAVVTGPFADADRDPHGTCPAAETDGLDRLLHAVATIPELSDGAFEALIPRLSDEVFVAIAGRRLSDVRVPGRRDS